eukprot:CAMPEP_0181298066 /NCGR_PEP_ID=MMETSP1101-20121128/5584_1 /TAXON_ID=46948 /ORGANISM="Rhodomonas abbreviata, Strain Caron Lab Isolate" /LENGTH=318 /DNA_ID=CAMNT_0023403063 /DNA_START=298 /DNA_END=1251 /DNA_ORIENTATION=+
MPKNKRSRKQREANQDQEDSSAESLGGPAVHGSYPVFDSEGRPNHSYLAQLSGMHMIQGGPSSVVPQHPGVASIPHSEGSLLNRQQQAMSIGNANLAGNPANLHLLGLNAANGYMFQAAGPSESSVADARLRQVAKDLRTMQFSDAIIRNVLKRLQAEQKASLASTMEHSEAMDNLISAAVLAATSGHQVDEDEDEERADPEDQEFDADTDVARELALSSRKEEREKRERELHCEWVRGNVLEHEELSESVFLRSLRACHNFSALCKRTVTRCQPDETCPVCGHDTGASGASEASSAPGGGKKRASEEGAEHEAKKAQ